VCDFDEHAEVFPVQLDGLFLRVHLDFEPVLRDLHAGIQRGGGRPERACVLRIRAIDALAEALRAIRIRGVQLVVADAALLVELRPLFLRDVLREQSVLPGLPGVAHLLRRALEPEVIAPAVPAALAAVLDQVVRVGRDDVRQVLGDLLSRQLQTFADFRRTFIDQTTHLSIF